MVDDDYDGASFVTRQVFFCGGDADEFDKFRKGLSLLAAASTKAKVERTLKVEIDDEAFERVYGFRSHPIPATKGRRVAIPSHGRVLIIRDAARRAHPAVGSVRTPHGAAVSGPLHHAFR